MGERPGKKGVSEKEREEMRKEKKDRERKRLKERERETDRDRERKRYSKKGDSNRPGWHRVRKQRMKHRD